MSVPTYLVEEDARLARQNRLQDHDHREVACDRLHYEATFEAWMHLTPPTVALISEVIADRIAREATDAR